MGGLQHFFRQTIDLLLNGSTEDTALMLTRMYGPLCKATSRSCERLLVLKGSLQKKPLNL